MAVSTSICTRYKSVDGWHVFESDEMPGLYVASKDAEAAYNDVGAAIETLLLLDTGIKCQAVPEVPFREFLAQAKEEDGDDDRPLTLSDKRYRLMECVA